MIKIYKAFAGNFKAAKKFFLFFAIGIMGFLSTIQAQNVTVTATAGAALRNYNTVREAFDAINDGTHQGVVAVKINTSTVEGTTPATLNSGDADPASYTSVTVYPTADGLTVQGNPATGLGVIQFNGADNVTFDGDNPNTGGINRNLTVTNTSVNTTQYSSVIRIATSAAVLSANNITVKNCIVNGNVTSGNVNLFGGSNNATFGIYAGGKGGATAIGAPTAITDPIADVATSGTTINNFTVSNNVINQCGRGVAFMGELSTVCNSLTISSNTIGAAGALVTYPYSTPATTVYSKGITLSGTNAFSITGNTIQNIMQYGNNNVFGIEVTGDIGTGTANIANNIISGVVNNGPNSDARGMMLGNIGAAFTVTANTISNVESSAPNLTSGIQVSGITAPGTFNKNIIRDVISRNTGGAAGINLAAAANGQVIQNNFIYDIQNNLGSLFTNLNRGVSGIFINSGSNHKIYHNSVNIYRNSTATASNFISCLTIKDNTLTGIDIRNNVFSNTVSAGGTASDANVCLFMPFTVSATMNLKLNNNAYYTGTVAGKSGIAFAGTAAGYNAANFYTVANFDATITTPATNWRNFSSQLGVVSNDNASVAISTGNPFTSNTNLHIPNGASLSPLESGAAAVGVTTDIDNDVRPGPAGSVNGGGLLPDIGADEFDRQPLDKFPPVITFTPPVTCGVGPRTLVATITDATGVPTAGLGLPVLYWKIGAGAWNPATAAYLSPTQYQFVIDPGSTALLGQTVDYYIVAQDIVTPTPNVIANPSAGAAGYTTSPPAVATAPTTLFSYTVIPNLAGVYTVGVGQTYTTLTAAVAAYNTSCLSGAVVFNLMDASYPSETFPITINANAQANATNTLTIKPNTSATISGNDGNALIKFNGADYVIIDGSNNGTSSQNLTITNLNVNTTATVIWIGSASTTNGATFNTVKNTLLNGSGSSTTLFVIAGGSGITLGNASEATNANNTINNCVIKACQNGFWINGKATTGFDQNWVISNNTIGSTSVANDKMGFRGMIFQNVDGFTISGNTINGVIVPSTSTSTATGISIFGSVINGNIFNNKISDIKQQNTGGWGANGILLGCVTGANVNVYNNFIWDVMGLGFSGTSSQDNGYGLMVESGGGYNISYNSILMGTNQTNSGSITAAINVSSAITAGNSLNIRNNIFANTETIGTRYSIYSGATAAVYQSINYNDYYFGSSTSLGFLSSARANLGAWQTATGKDGNSVAVNPSFVSATDLHVNNTSPLNALATPIAGITIDIDNAARNVTTPDIGADEFTAPDCNASSGGVATASVTTLCGSGTATLSATGYSTGEGLTYQWQYSTVSAAGPWTNLAGQLNPAGATTGIINVTTYYHLVATCSFTGLSTPVSNTVTITINNPQVLTTTPATRCGTGTVNLGATTSGGATLNWYAASTGGASLATGSPYSPVVAATTTYYVSAILGGVSEFGGKPAQTTNSSTIFTQSGIIFNANTAFTLNSTVIYPTGTGTITIALYNSSLVELATTAAIAVTGTGGSTPVTVPLGFNVPVGTGYFLMVKAYTGITGLNRDFSPNAFPYNSPSGALSVTAGTLTPPTASTTYYFFYNLNISTGCESARTPVTATVNPSPTLSSVTATPSTICQGQSSSLNVTSSNAGYSYTWTPGALAGATVSVSPNTTTTYTVTANDVSGGTYNGCGNVGTVTVTVNPSPSVVTVSPHTQTVCAGTAVPLTVSGGAIQLSVIADSGPLSITIPDSDVNGISNGLVIGGIPGAATIDSVVVEFSTTMTFDGDLIYNLEAPNGEIINLVNRQGSSGDDFTNTRITSDNSAGPITAASAPFTGTYRAMLNALLVTVTNPATTQTTWAPLYGTPNGTWKLRAYDRAGLDVGTLTNWKIKVSYTAAAIYNWTEFPNNGTLAPTTGPSVTGTPNVNTTYYATATNGIGCSRTDSAVITVNSATASVTIAAVPPSPICAGTSVTFTATPTNGGAAPTYQWYIGAVNVGSGPTYTTTTLNNGDVVTVQMTSNAACIVGNPFTSNAIPMTVNPNASCTIAGPDPVCANVAGNIYTTTVLPAGGTVTHNWTISGNGVIIGATNTASVSVTAGAAGSYTLTDNITRNGCASTCTKTVTVNPGLPVSVTISGDNNNNPICLGTTVVFTAVPVNPGAAPTYQWQVNGGNVGVGGPTYTTSTLTNGQIVTVILTSNATCATGSPATSNGITMTVLASAPAAVTISASAACIGQPVTLTANPTNQGASPSYVFNIAGVNQAAQPGATFTYTPVANDAVYVVLTSSLNCPNPNTATSTPIVLSRQAVPTIAATATCTTLFAGSGQQTTLSANATAGSGSITGYQWYIGGVAIGGATAATYTTSVAGSYTVMVTNSNGCSTTNTITPVVITVVTSALPAGIYTIPGTACNTFSSIASAITYINTYGVSGVGGVIFNITGAYTETAPVGGFRITASGTNTNQIVFQKASGANPVITAAVPTTGVLSDAIFKLVGADYISLRNLTLQEHGTAPVFTAGTNNMTEWGVALLQASATNGAQFDSVYNCTISLNRSYSNSYGIYSNANHAENSPTTQNNITNATGSNSNNHVVGNVVSNVNFGIAFIGCSNAGLYDVGNDIGGTSALTGNTISNWGGATAATNFAGASAGAYTTGITTRDQFAENVSYNTLTSAAFTGAGVNTRGIFKSYSVNPASGTFVSAITNNTITINAGFTSGVYEYQAIRNEGITALLSTATININNNIITGGSTAAGGSPTTTMIYNISVPGTLSMNANKFYAFNSQATAGGAFIGITSTSAVTTLNINNNEFGNATANSILVNNATLSGIIVSGTATANKSIDGNLFNNITNTASGIVLINTTGGTTACSINANVSSNINASGVSTGITVSGSSMNATITANSVAGISNTSSVTGITSGASGTIIIDNNTVDNLSTTGPNNITGMQVTTACSITNNNVSNLLVNSGSPATASIYGLLVGNVGVYTITGNNFFGFSSNSISGNGSSTGMVDGIYVAAGTTVNIAKNKFYNFAMSGVSSTTIVQGIHIGGGSAVNISNNYISDLRNTASTSLDGIRGIGILNATASTTYSIYYNTIYLKAASSGTDFGTSGIYHNANPTATTVQMYLRNNIIVNESTAGSNSGVTAALRRSGTNIGNYNTTSNNNIFYAGTPSTKNLVYYDGTNSAQTVTDFQMIAGTAPRESLSIWTLPNFVNNTVTPYDLHLVAGANCSADGQALPITGYTDDYDGDARNATTPDIGADEFNGTGTGIGMWKGVNSNWLDVNNWCGALPTSATNVTIPASAAFYPIITTSGPVAKNINIQPGGMVTISGVGGKLGIYGTIANTGIFNVVDGTIEMAGSSAQVIPAAVFQNNDLKNLVLNNASVTLAGTLNIYGKVSYTGNNRVFATAGFLTLRSTATGTASLGDITNNGTSSGNSITGNVTVERFMSMRRAWRFLSAPTQHNLQNIHQSWQENQAANALTPAGYGIHITSDRATWAADGFDAQTTPGPSVKTYNPVTTSWDGITATIGAAGNFVTGKAYMTLVRGDRTINYYQVTATTTTVLRDKGTLITGTFGPVAVGAGQFAAIGNPYASAVDYTKLVTANLTPFYYLWDPALGSLGAYQTISGGVATPGGGSYTSGNVNIESGQAFFVRSSGPAGTVTFNEPAKVDGSYLVSKQTTTSKQLRANLYLIDSSGARLYDGVLSTFDAAFANTVDAEDALKLVNFGENLGIQVGDSRLSIDSRKDFIETDTVFYNLAQMRVMNYRFEFVAENLNQPGLEAFLEDTYLQTKTPVSLTDTTRINFSIITQAGSFAADRFRLVFKAAAPVPVTFTSIRANKQDANIMVEWKVENELNIHHYDVEKSTDGRNFSKVGQQAATGTGSGATLQYNWLDTHPVDGDNFYRVKSVGIGTDAKLSQVVRVNIGKQPSFISVYPNPVLEDRVVNISLNNEPEGTYQLVLVNSEGQTVYKNSLNHAGGNSVYSIKLDKKIAHGNYLLNIWGDNNVKLTYKIVY